ncbi:MAG: hypothetical protein IMZ55_06620 [Acidobacteria bacterium]|nr:hypothetical protein [Spirochaetota bacterium]MBE3133127.1 hypothetical protein [Acidobacteriota bacterium]
MAKRGFSRDGFEARRRKEHFAFLVVKFLKAFTSFSEIYREFNEASRRGCLSGCGLFEKVKELEESLAFDLKEKAHALFRARPSPAARPTRSSARDTRRQLAELESAIETKSLDSYIGTGFHLLLILRESLYQIERYSPQYEKEQEEIGRIEELARVVGYSLSPAERDEMERIRTLGGISAALDADARDMAERIIERCNALFKGSAEVIRHIMTGSSDNEILIQNLLQNRGLIEAVYGPGAAESIFSQLCSGKSFTGKTGLERAMAYARGRCGNTTALPAS